MPHAITEDGFDRDADITPLSDEARAWVHGALHAVDSLSHHFANPVDDTAWRAAQGRISLPLSTLREALLHDDDGTLLSDMLCRQPPPCLARALEAAACRRVTRHEPLDAITILDLIDTRTLTPSGAAYLASSDACRVTLVPLVTMRRWPDVTIADLERFVYSTTRGLDTVRTHGRPGEAVFRTGLTSRWVTTGADWTMWRPSFARLLHDAAPLPAVETEAHLTTWPVPARAMAATLLQTSSDPALATLGHRLADQ